MATKDPKVPFTLCSNANSGAASTRSINSIPTPAPSVSCVYLIPFITDICEHINLVPVKLEY